MTDTTTAAVSIIGANGLIEATNMIANDVLKLSLQLIIAIVGLIKIYKLNQNGKSKPDNTAN